MGRGTEKEEGVNKQHPRVQSCLIPLIGTQPTRIQGFSNNLICQLGFVGLGFFEVFFFGCCLVLGGGGLDFVTLFLFCCLPSTPGLLGISLSLLLGAHGCRKE